MQRMKLIAGLALATAAMAAAHAGEGPGGYPNKPLRLIVPFLAGGATDQMARGMAQKLAEALGQPVVVDNRAGAGGGIGAEAVASAAKDGYTLLYSTMGVLTINPSLYPNLKYDPATSFAPVGLTHVTANLLVVNPQVPAKSVAELVALARSKPGALTFSSAGNGTSSHLSGELFKSIAGVDMQHVPYKGSSAGLPDLIAGRIDMTFDTASLFGEYTKNGKLRPLAVTSRTRMPAMPEVPAMAQAPGFSDYDVSLWLGVLAPAGTAPEIVQYLNRTLVKVMREPSMEVALKPYGIQPLHSSPEEFAKVIERDRRKWAAVVKSAHVKAD
ncbi:Bug family tripartite tricarboxylate transporter substrate binding protein [Comamonas endophytica]|uniref:Tripartite tricarboxylate transporter substrate binding protein n=1 Tax=Comamonas endophytica TaxID=2949090 RepID=A0ABY6GEP6_9BURK|nr:MULTISPECIES: tripartite tricarboxylate transporter substrate binding protein [unclassified Acidovorax]MCD2514317.1 tripartite tricarboxylate transporter substrate binding protein [Acidovorax sp. D4N7]UYG53566.1 tripartite tricarboxylate transporter substrate binding protein [Acidovorax sp. 5MLIR]